MNSWLGCLPSEGWRETKLDTKKKFVFALIAFAVLAILAWSTLSDDPIRVDLNFFALNVRLRTATLLVLGLFVFRTLLYMLRLRLEQRDSHSEKAGSD